MKKEIKSLPFSGVSCKEQGKNIVCKAWWLGTVNDRTVTIEAKIPLGWGATNLLGIAPRLVERRLTTILKDSGVDVQGIEI